MDLSITPIQSSERKIQALVEAAQAIERDAGAAHAVADAVSAAATGDAATALVHGGFVERVLGEVRPDATAAPAEPAGALPDHSPETAALQTFARAQPSVPEPPPRHQTALPIDQHAGSDFAVPASLLVPATLAELQVQPATIWPLPGHGINRDPIPPQGVSRDDERRPPAPEPEAPEEPTADARRVRDDDPSSRPRPDAGVLDAVDDALWCEPLTRALRAALAAPVPPRSLLAAAEQWQRGRCVVLACPRGADPSGPGWAFVLWPSADAAAVRLSLRGLRVEASLQWQSLPPPFAWCHLRVVKEHHPRRGRQLVPSDLAAGARAACEVQLGPVLASSGRACDVRVHVRAAQRFWAALGTQWSAHVVVSARALCDPAPTAGGRR